MPVNINIIFFLLIDIIWKLLHKRQCVTNTQKKLKIQNESESFILIKLSKYRYNKIRQNEIFKYRIITDNQYNKRNIQKVIKMLYFFTLLYLLFHYYYIKSDEKKKMLELW